MRILFLAPGTWHGRWTLPDSPCRVFLQSRGYDTYVLPWSYDVGGLPNVTNNPEDAGRSDWIAGGYSARFRLDALIGRGVVDPSKVDIVTHSHGINLAIFQAINPAIDGSPPIQIRNLISICAPPRHDMQAPYKQARDAGMIGYHRAIYCDGWDPWARFGQAFDGSWGWTREWKGADKPVPLKDIGHTNLIEDERYFGALADQIRLTLERG